MGERRPYIRRYKWIVFTTSIYTSKACRSLFCRIPTIISLQSYSMYYADEMWHPEKFIKCSMCVLNIEPWSKQVPMMAASSIRQPWQCWHAIKLTNSFWRTLFGYAKNKKLLTVFHSTFLNMYVTMIGKKKLHVRTLIVHLEGETLFFESHRLSNENSYMILIHYF